MRVLSFVLATFLISCATPQTQTPALPVEDIMREVVFQLEPSFREKMKKQEYIKGIADPILWKNTDLCDGSFRYGFSYIDKVVTQDLEAPYKILYPRYYGFGKMPKNPTITRVEAFSPAEKAGLKVGDRIEKMNGRIIESKKVRDNFFKKVFWKSEFVEMLNYSKQGYGQNKALPSSVALAMRKASPATFTIRRNRSLIEITMTPERSCADMIYLVEKQEINAFTDGKNLFVTEGMLNFASETELALIIAHELAHCIEKHLKAKETNSLLFGFLGGAIGGIIGVNSDLRRIGNSWGRMMAEAGANAFSQEFEQEADYVGMYLLARAGYSTDGVESFWRRIAERNPEKANSFDGTHPSSAYRYILIERTHAEIEKKKKEGLPLLPNRKTAYR